MAWNKVLVVIVAGALAACGNEMNVTDTGSNTDSGTTDVTANDTGTTGDTGGNSDTGTPTDVPSTGDTGTGTDGGGGMFGTCGMTTHTCLCTCGNDQACQQGCFSDTTCQQCVVQAQAMCCPTEANTFLSCAMAAQMASDAGPACTTQACIQQRCMSEVMAFQACVNTASASDTTCQGYLGECLGNYPIQCM